MKVYIVISNVNDCPIPVDDVYYVDEGGSLTVDTCMVDGGDGYQNWDTGEPSNDSGIENAAVIEASGMWNDVDDVWMVGWSNGSWSVAGEDWRGAWFAACDGCESGGQI